MSTSLILADTPATAAFDFFQVIANRGYFYVSHNGVYLTDKTGRPRTYTTSGAARKRISRERSGDFHA